MKESKETKKTRNITFRLTDEEYAQVEKTAEAAGYDPNNWCRKAAIDKSREGVAFSKNECGILEKAHDAGGPEI